MIPIILAFALTCGGDAVSTHVGLDRGFHETILTQNPWVNDGIIAGQAVAGILAYRALRKDHPKLALTLAIVGVAMHGSAAGHNFSLIMTVPVGSVR